MTKRIGPDGVFGWTPRSADFTLTPNEKDIIDGSGGTVDASLPTTLEVGDEFIVHNESISTNLVRILNPSFTIKGPKGTVTAGDNLLLAASDTPRLIVRAATVLEVLNG